MKHSDLSTTVWMITKANRGHRPLLLLQPLRGIYISRRPPFLYRQSSSHQAPTEDDKRRVYILGTGNEATFLACALRSGPNPPPVSFLTPKERRLKEFEKIGRKATLVIPGGMEHIGTGIQIELYPQSNKCYSPDELSKFNSQPIFNLITTIRSCFLAETLGEFKHRLSKESAVLVSCFGVGFMKQIFQSHFQDPMSRPTFYQAISGQSFWEVSKSGQRHKDNLASMLKGTRHRQPGFKVALRSTGKRLRIGPPILQEGVENAQVVNERQSQSRYLINTLLQSPFLGANEVDSGLLVFLSLKRLVLSSVTGPLAVMKECPNAELFTHEADLNIGSALVFEAWSVLRRHLPYLQLYQVSGWISEELAKTGSQLHPMLVDALDGRETNIDDINGWIVREAHRFGIPCDHHEAMLAMVKAKVESIKKEIAAAEAAKRENSKSQRDNSYPRNSKKLAEPLDKLEVKRMKKAESQRKKLGHQDMPDYATPSIKPLGKRGK